MGRPADQFCWDNVDKLSNNKWRCKHCKEKFSGAASRIIKHLSGVGTDIRSCEAVPSHVRAKASRRASKKRERNSSLGEGSDGITAGNRSEGISASANNSLDMATVLQVSSSSNGDFSTNTANKGSEQEYTTDVLVRFLMSRNFPVEAAKDPHFKTLLMRVAKHGVPSCLFQDDFVGLQKSVWHIEHEVNEYMLMVKESWKTTGCTLIRYNLDDVRGKTSALDTNTVVYGFYCPKGFIFIDGRQLDLSNGISHGFKNHVLSLSIDDITLELQHDGHRRCEFAGQYDPDMFGGIDNMCCVRQKVQLLWRQIWTKIGWVQPLIQKSEELYEFILNSEFYEDWRKEMVEKDEYDLLTRSFTHLRSIMHLEDKIKARLSNIFQEYNKFGVDCAIGHIITNNKFWSDGKDLLEVVAPLIGIIDLVDTLVPNVGYIPVAIDKAKHNLKTYNERVGNVGYIPVVTDKAKHNVGSNYLRIKECLDTLEFVLPPSDDAITFLSPTYNAWRAAGVDLDPTMAESYLRRNVRREEAEEVVAEFKEYISKNPFARLSYSQWKYNHPVTLWNKYGGGFPILKKCAIKLLSQPGSCMCKQVKQQMLQCQGKDNFILRLNYQMMQRFPKFGDEIYKPVDDSFFEDEDREDLDIYRYHEDLTEDLTKDSGGTGYTW